MQLQGQESILCKWTEPSHVLTFQGQSRTVGHQGWQRPRPCPWEAHSKSKTQNKTRLSEAAGTESSKPGGGCLCPGHAGKASQKRYQLCWAVRLCRNRPRGHRAEGKRESQVKAGQCEPAMLGSEHSVPWARARAQEKQRRKPKASLHL